MHPLNRKLLRELWKLRGQVASIAIVVATGIMTVVTMRGGYDTLALAQREYYDASRFADIWASSKRAPLTLRSQIEAIPGVSGVDTRITFLATLDLPEMEVPGLGRFVSVPDAGRPAVNDIRLTTGRYLAPGARNEVILSQNFAEARGQSAGDTIRAVMNGRAWDLTVVGVATSPEHSYAVPPGALYPEDERYGVLWMSDQVLGPAYDMDGAFNEVALTLAEGANPNAVMAGLDRLLEPYGGQGAYRREDQASHNILESELDQNRVMGTAIPIVFLGVAAFLLNLVLGRLIATQRTEIAVLKAFGYSSREVGLHYLWYAVVAVGVGAVLGVVGGAWLGSAYIDLYARYFSFPNLAFRLSLPLVVISIGVSAVAAIGGALSAARRAANLPPAEAMRPEPPRTYEPGPLERVGIARILPSSGRIILRNMERSPVRSLLSSLGVGFSVAILIIGMFMFDGIGLMMDLQFRETQREDLTVSFERPVDATIEYDLRNLAGVRRAELFRVVPSRLRVGNRERQIGIQGFEAGGRLRRIVSADGSITPMPYDGLILSRVLAESLDVSAGESVRVELLEGERRTREVVVASTVDDLMGVSATMSRDALRRLAGGPDVVSGAFLTVNDEQRPDLNATLKEMPLVAGVSSPAIALDSFETQLAESLFIAIGFLLGFAGIISVAIIYNGARIALSERGRELASLRVMGFRRSEVSTLLLGEQAVVTLLAIPIGWAMGYGLSRTIAMAFQTEMFRMPVVVSARTYVIAAIITAIAAFGSGLIVRRRVDHLDLIEVLKTRE